MAYYTMAIVGAGDMIGNELIELIEQRETQIEELRLLGAEGTAGTKIRFRDEELRVEKLTEQAFGGVDVALFCAGGEISREFLPHAISAGAIGVDMTGMFRRDPHVPLIIPEVNPYAVRNHRGILATPTTATILLALAIQPIYDEVGISRIVVTSFHAASEEGQHGIAELETQTRYIFTQRDILCQVYPHQIAFNAIPHVGAFSDNGYTLAEMNLIDETTRILQDDALRITATAVQMPVFYGHALSVNLETEDAITPEEIRQILGNAPSVKVLDEPQNNLYPLPTNVSGESEVFVGRIRQDVSVENGINLWIAADNLRRGTALNALQIAELVMREA
ncbi:aspartate-semialdehyde dehydrogenase [Candidatus Moduliflexus flocculans]|uniref:Aspartate-semialdehyde dehydrogenase n=1 Tax=Candidatus Moduliflexus flocculans TaxID=1499966 RepID=A0A0S6VQ89_9BACT|nr:aspartate-semialdehyde dehydrogenase [Candidatus Moduliflexus flocculans]